MKEETQSLFVTDEQELINNSWDLLLRKESETERYRRTQREIIRSIFKDE